MRVTLRPAVAHDLDFLVALASDDSVEPFLGARQPRGRDEIGGEIERGFHRLELEVYAFNDTALRLADRVGYVREGLKRQAYRRHGRWNDAVLFSLLRDDLGDP